MRKAWLGGFLPFAFACGDAKTAPPPACADVSALVAVTDYLSSGVGGFALDGGGALSFGVDLGKDPALTTSRGRAFFVARDSDTVFELEPRCGTASAKFALHDPAHVGSSNPQDVAVAPDGALWVPRYNTPSIAIVRSEGRTDTIELSPYDADGNPNASSIRIVDVGGAAKAFVTLERLDDKDKMRSKQPSMMLRVDVATAKIEDAIVLAGRNPFGLIFEDEGALWLAESGNFDASDEPLAGIERFDTKTSTSKLLVREADLGASAVQVAVSGKCGVAIVANAVKDVNATSLVTFDPETGAVLARNVIGPTRNYDLQGLAWVRDGGTSVLLVGDRQRSADRGYPVHALERAGDCELHVRPDAIFLSQKPASLQGVR